ncbi:hypothetical protein Sjap_019208 [Stephania japonica]|uniref:Homeobox domain-containing protein n=1 Tax=Stephania japonica TaxID=461633 RepID=A0AAP0HZI1_9MAGN
MLNKFNLIKPQHRALLLPNPRVGLTHTTKPGRSTSPDIKLDPTIAFTSSMKEDVEGGERAIKVGLCGCGSSMEDIAAFQKFVEDGIDEDALEAFFSQLEKDLNIDLSDDGCDEELSEEDLLGLGKNDERPIQLKNWQLRRLASALKIGRRKTSIKSLAAELCLDRTLVLKLLRDPPPNLLLLSAALPDKVKPANLELETEIVEPSPPKAMASTVEPEPEVSEPVHVMQKRWSMQKRLKKVQVETLERVYKRSKRPTNAMISSIVHVTNLPKKRIVQWFEEKRAEEGVPDNRRPYHRSSDTVFTNKSL